MNVQIQSQEVLYFAALFVIAFLSSVVHAAYDSKPNSFVRLFIIGFQGGFLSIGILPILLCDRSSGSLTDWVSPWWGVALASLLGFVQKPILEILLSKLPIAMANWFMVRISRIFGIDIKDLNNDNPDDNKRNN